MNWRRAVGRLAFWMPMGLLVFCMPMAAVAECDTGRCAYFQAQAAAECASYRMGAEGRDKAQRLSGMVLDFLRQSDADVVLLARVGSNAPSERFVRKVGKDGTWNYTHGGLAFRTHPNGEWTVVQLLNVCGELGGVFAESLEEFFLDNPWEYRAVVAVPSPDMQAALGKVILADEAALSLHDGGVYSSISYPFSLARQNSNEYILDVFAAALADMEGRDVAGRRAVKEYFLSSPHRPQLQPEMIQTGMFEQIALQIGLGPDNATLDDHPSQSRAGGEYEFVSVGSLVQFLENIGHLSSAMQFQLSDVEKASDTVLSTP